MLVCSDLVGEAQISLLHDVREWRFSGNIISKIASFSLSVLTKGISLSIKLHSLIFVHDCWKGAPVKSKCCLSDC